MGLVAFAAGMLFALGLGLSGMTQPQTVRAFLDVGGAWDPSLAFVMLGAIVVHVPFAARAKRPGARPVLAPRFVLPPQTRVDRRLLSGAALFGIGWGVSGYCPGPALVSLADPSLPLLVFVSAMLVAIWLYGALFEGATSAARVVSIGETRAET